MLYPYMEEKAAIPTEMRLGAAKCIFENERSKEDLLALSYFSKS
jgi:hypothetical protein